jgi:hypothetical protein
MSFELVILEGPHNLHQVIVRIYIESEFVLTFEIANSKNNIETIAEIVCFILILAFYFKVS